MKHITIVMPYYDNPQMLSCHYSAWASYMREVKARFDVVIVDDGSPNMPAADVPRPAGLPDLAIFRVLVDKPWHQHAARNIGAHEARGPWLLLTDMDHLVPERTLMFLLENVSNGSRPYTFTRLDAPDLVPKLHPRTGLPHPHPNSFAMTKELYWLVGGYDEDFCGVYGTDGLFRSRLFKVAEPRHLEEACLIRYPAEVVGDANTRTLPRKEGRPDGAKQAIVDRKRAEGRDGVIATLTMPYKRVL